ncbi:MAG: replication factor C large subunit [Nanoarchaeota archaeon]|nr:replication factor C large subunit [Nanoarchaeota archaeon]
MQLQTQSFAEKYRAQKYSDLVGQNKAIQEVQKFLKEFPKRKAILLYGPPGTGKTSLVLTAAKENNLEIFELNSSDLRNKAKLEKILKPASEQESLFKKGKILLMDEVDGVTGTDIGGVPELIRIIDRTFHPLIMTGNDIWQSKFVELRRKCKLIEMKALNTETVINFLKKIIEKEKIEENIHFLRQIALKSQGDIRASLNDLQTYSLENISSLDYLEKRDKEENIFHILKLLFQERQNFLGLFDNTKMSLDEILLWIEENIPKEYKNETLANAYLALSNADKFRGRIYRQQFWRFLLYQNIFQSAGISYAKKYPNHGFVKYDRPKRILKIWLNNQKIAKKKTIAQKYAKYVHYSAKRALKDFNTIKIILKANPEIQNKLKLSEEEIAFLEK